MYRDGMIRSGTHYSKEYEEACAKALERSARYVAEHTHESVRDYEVAGYYIRCIQIKYDSCLNRKNMYKIQVWVCNPENVKADEVYVMCVDNKTFDNPEDANNYYKRVRELCY